MYVFKTQYLVNCIEFERLNIFSIVDFKAAKKKAISRYCQNVYMCIGIIFYIYSYTNSVPQPRREINIYKKPYKMYVCVAGRIDEALENRSQDQFEILLYRKNSKYP
jgi:hypothetical protein